MATIQASTEQEIHMIMEAPNFSFSWILSAMYASPRYREHCLLWGNLEAIAQALDIPWIVLGDFNEILS